MSINDQVNTHINSGRTLLGVGVISKQCVDSAIMLANKYKRPILLIASRSQVDDEEFGGGYSNNWTTGEFSRYVRAKDKGGYILLARDHGGPWQNPRETEERLNDSEAFESAKHSFQADINAGFNCIHIDTSKALNMNFTLDDSIEMLLELYLFCCRASSDIQQDLIFEIGTEEQSENTTNISDNRYILSKVYTFLNKNNLVKPKFIVMQTGTKVISDRNCGILDSYHRYPNQIPPEIIIPQIISLCNEYHIFLKEHNLDYCSEELLHWHPKLGIHAANVAPEFAVRQTQAIFRLLNDNKLTKHVESLYQIATSSLKWTKWADKSIDTSDFRKACLSLHYSYSQSSVIEILEDASICLSEKDISFDRKIRTTLDNTILRYLKAFRYV